MDSLHFLKSKLDSTFKIFVIAGLTVAFAGTSYAKEIKFKADIANPYLLANNKQKTYLKVGLTGFKLDEETKRAPVNVAIVLDRSSSMSGEKIRQARNAAVMAINRLSANDIVSIVAYDDTVTVVVPATKLTDRSTVISRIREITPGGTTALFAGVSKGADELRKFKSKERVNRVILLSDGLANVGPSSPGELAELGASLGKENISVTTIGLGLGYNEDLMVQLAKKSDGNHAFVEHPRDLVRIFNYEFGDVLSVVAQNVEIHIRCGNGTKPLRVLNRDGIIDGRRVIIRLNQLYSTQEKYILLELEPPKKKAAEVADLASIKVSYNNMHTNKRTNLTRKVAANYTASPEKVNASINKAVMVNTVLQLATLRSKQAVRERDKGNKEEAKRLLEENADYLQSNAVKYNSPKLKKAKKTADLDAKNVEDDSEWQGQRKRMRKDQNATEIQQAY